NQGDEGGDIDHRAAAGFDQFGDAVLAAERQTLDIDGHGSVPDGVGGGQDRFVGFVEDARVVVQDVELPEVADGSLDEGPNVSIVRNVADHRHRLPLQAGDGFVDRPVVDVGRDHLGTFANK